MIQSIDERDLNIIAALKDQLEPDENLFDSSSILFDDSFPLLEDISTVQASCSEENEQLGQMTPYKCNQRLKPVITWNTQDALPSTSHHVGIHLPTTSPSIHYIPKKSGKYRAAWRTLIPFRKTKRAVYEVPLDKLGLFSYITCTWMTTFLHKSWNPSFSEQEIVIGASTDSSDINGQRFKLLLSDEIVKSGVLNSSLCHVVWLFIRTRIIIACVLSLLGSFFSIIGLVLFLYPYFLTFREQIDSRERSTDWISPLIFIFSQVIAVFLQSWSTNLTYRTAVRLRSAFLSVMYRHLVRVSVLSSLSVQQIVTVMATDSQRLFHAVTCVPSVITAPLIFIICSIILMWSYTASLIQSPSCGMEHLRIAAVNIVASLFIFPLMYLLAKAASVFKSRATNSASDRLTKLHEMLSHIRLVKIASWEKFFLSKVKDFRRMECEFGRKAHVVDSFGVSLYHTAPVITALLLCYVNSTSALYIMVLILLLVPMKDSLLKFWDSVSGISSAQASLERLRNVLLLDKSKQSTEKPMNRLVAVAVSNANFVLKSNNVLCNQYDNENCFSCRKCSTRSYELEKDEELEMQDKTLLTNISFSAPKGKLIGICGARGSGKTTLLLAILGHLNLGYGKVFRDGMFSYVSQNPWIWDATLRDNILFNEIFNHKRYYQAIHCCSLNDDIQHLPGGDQTKLHGKSLSLSQRQRVAVARALYACRDICLFDNFLSALDERMASDIFEKAILTHLREKTVIITSQNEEFLSHCDEIYLLEDGEITDRGSYEDLLSTAGNRFTDLLEHHSGELSVKNCQGPKHFPLFSNSVMNVPSVMAEDEDRGQTDSLQMAKFSSNILLAYAKSSQIFLPIVNSATLGIAFIILVLTSVVVCAWIKGDSSDQEFNPHMNWIPSVIVLILITSISGSIIFYKVLEKVLLIIHNTWLEKICSTSITFFQETWVSDIMKWFSLYLQTIDTYLPTGAANVMLQLTFVPLSILIIIMTSAWFLIPVFVIAILSFLLCHIFKPGLIKLQSLEEESSSPMYTFVASSLAGRATIQAYGKENDYLAMFVKLCDVNATCTQLVSGAICWFNFRIQMISALGTTLILSLIVTAHTFNFQDFLFVHSPLWETVSQVGATMLFVLILGNTFQGALQSTMILITKFSSVGQLDARICNLEPINSRIQQSNLPANWPTDGSIIFKNVRVKCWQQSSVAPYGMSFTIHPNEKIGILHLTGHHNQSLVDVLYCLVDLSQGSVYIGGTEVSRVPVEKLHASIALIPYNPVLFSGSVRQNMDPDGQYTDSELQEGLEKVALWDVVKKLPGKLDSKMEHLANKLSELEHHLIYVARAILKDPKVLVLEEPYSCNDTGTQNKIHAMVKRLFPTSTVLVVTHSVLTVLDCHGVAVMKDGELLEYGTPQQLFKNSKSRFSKMLTASTNNLFETSL